MAMTRMIPILLAMTLLLASPAWASRDIAVTGGERRVALVIGNGAYKDAPLKNPPNDAKAMAQALKGLGFEVLEHTNLDQKSMNRAINVFGEKLRGGGVGLFFYAGHGMQVKGRNFLVPVDAQISSEASVRTEAVDVDAVLDQLPGSERALNLIILDACRNNPFERRFRSTGGGLAQIDAPAGTLIAYATAPGKVASDGEGEHGLYTSELLKALEEPGLKVEEVFKRVRSRVSARSGNAQLPWESSSLTGDFVFRQRGGDKAAGDERPPAAIDREALFWQSVKDSSSEVGLGEYLRQYPNGAFASLARIRIDELREQEKQRERDISVQRPQSPPPSGPSPQLTGLPPAFPPATGAQPPRPLTGGNPQPSSSATASRQAPDIARIAHDAFLRGEPSPQAASVGVVRAGTTVALRRRATAHGANWYEVEPEPGVRGFVPEAFIERLPDFSPPPAAKPPTGSLAPDAGDTKVIEMSRGNGRLLRATATGESRADDMTVRRAEATKMAMRKIRTALLNRLSTLESGLSRDEMLRAIEGGRMADATFTADGYRATVIYDLEFTFR